MDRAFGTQLIENFNQRIKASSTHDSNVNIPPKSYLSTDG